MLEPLPLSPGDPHRGRVGKPERPAGTRDRLEPSVHRRQGLPGAGPCRPADVPVLVCLYLAAGDGDAAADGAAERPRGSAQCRVPVVDRVGGHLRGSQALAGRRRRRRRRRCRGVRAAGSSGSPRLSGLPGSSGSSGSVTCVGGVVGAVVGDVVDGVTGGVVAVPVLVDVAGPAGSGSAAAATDVSPTATSAAAVLYARTRNAGRRHERRTIDDPLRWLGCPHGSPEPWSAPSRADACRPGVRNDPRNRARPGTWWIADPLGSTIDHDPVSTPRWSRQSRPTPRRGSAGSRWSPVRSSTSAATVSSSWWAVFSRAASCAPARRRPNGHQILSSRS